jgi:hypothetical protein
MKFFSVTLSRARTLENPCCTSGVFERGTPGIIWLKLVKMTKDGYCLFIGIWSKG